jgi:arylsulfatase A-like enzyme
LPDEFFSFGVALKPGERFLNVIFTCRQYYFLAIAICASFFIGADAAADRPNILFIFSDDHAYQAMSCYPRPLVLNETPNLDRLARSGMRFDRCLVTNSICGPSRAVILTGKYSHANGFYNNTNSRFDGAQITFPKLLKSAGYSTALVGKWHLVSEPTGFDYWQILPGQGVYYNPPMNDNGKPVKHTGYTTEILTDLALDWLKHGRDKDKPFLLMCQHKAPHREWSPSLKQLGKYEKTKFPEPATLFDTYAGRGKAEHAQDMTVAKTMTPLDLKLTSPSSLNLEQRAKWDAYYEPKNEQFRKANPQGKELVRWRYQRYMHDYLSCIASVDESVGQLLDYLAEAGLEENTVVVYASDQGFYLGEHGWFDKRWIFEESLRTPLLVRWPGVTKPGSTNADLVSNVDFAATLLDAAGVEIPGDLHGKSLRSILAGTTPTDWRKSFYYHYYEFPGPHQVARHYGVVTNRYKLVRFYDYDNPAFEEWELFDLKNDPQEMKSVYDDPKYAEAQGELHAELKRLRSNLSVPENDPPETAIAPAARRQPGRASNRE